MTGAFLGAWVLLFVGSGPTPPVYFNTQAHCEAVRDAKMFGKSNWVCFNTGFPEVKQ
jgi:hypothetical protein